MMRRATGADWGLRLRMFITMGLLAALYLGFLSYLASRGVGIGFLVGIAAVILGLQYFFSDKLAMRGMGAKEVSQEEAPQLHAMVERLAAEAGVPKPRVAISEMPIMNAFATGRNPKNAVVAVTEQLWTGLDRNEVEAVLAHEISHVVHRDVTVMTLASFFAMLAMLLMRSFFFMGLFGGGRSRGSQGGGSFWMIYLVTIAVYFVSQILILALGRYRELAADRGGAYLTRRPRDLASALRKIADGVTKTDPRQRRAVEQMNAFFIVPTKLKELFSSHPPLDRRIRELEEIERELHGA